jgi:hypothetical protein
MDRKELANAAKNGFAMYGQLARILMGKIGEKKLYDAVADMGEESGAAYGEWTKLGPEGYSKQLLASQLSGGWDSEVKVEGGKVTLVNHTCPCYTGMRESGLTHEQAKNMCYAWWRNFPESAKKNNHSVKNFKIEKYRDNESDYCLEVFELKDMS